MKELNDYSGEYRPDLKLEDFSKEALISLLKSYQIAFVGFMGMWNTVNRERMSLKDAFKLDGDVYEKWVNKFALPLMTKAMSIQGNDVLTMIKYFQVAMDGAREGLYEFNYDIKNNNHVILTFTSCPSLLLTTAPIPS